MTLTPDELGSIANYLRVAALRFDDHVLHLETQTDLAVAAGLARQFREQAQDARRLASVLDNTESVADIAACTVELHKAAKVLLARVGSANISIEARIHLQGAFDRCKFAIDALEEAKANACIPDKGDQMYSVAGLASITGTQLIKDNADDEGLIAWVMSFPRVGSFYPNIGQGETCQRTA